MSVLSKSQPLVNTLDPRDSCFLVLWMIVVRHERLQLFKGGRSGFPEHSDSENFTSGRSFISALTRSPGSLAGILETLI